MRKQHSKFRDLILYGKRGAFYSTLIRLANSYGKQEEDGVLISVPLTNQELANYSGTARESLNRMLSELRKEGVLEYRGHLLLIKDLDYLKQAIQC
jgi:CRP/FNR family transcriptional regulator